MYQPQQRQDLLNLSDLMTVIKVKKNLIIKKLWKSELKTLYLYISGSNWVAALSVGASQHIMRIYKVPLLGGMRCTKPIYINFALSPFGLILIKNDSTHCIVECMLANSFAPYLCNDPHFSASLSASSTGRQGKRLSEVTSLINELAACAFMRRAICSRPMVMQHIKYRDCPAVKQSGHKSEYLVTVCASHQPLWRHKPQRGRLHRKLSKTLRLWLPGFRNRCVSEMVPRSRLSFF